MRRFIRHVADCVIPGFFCVGCTLPVIVLWWPRSRFWDTFDLSPEVTLLLLAFTAGVGVGLWRIRNQCHSGHDDTQ